MWIPKHLWLKWCADWSKKFAQELSSESVYLEREIDIRICHCHCHCHCHRTHETWSTEHSRAETDTYSNESSTSQCNEMVKNMNVRYESHMQFLWDVPKMIRLHIEHHSATFIAAFCHKVSINKIMLSTEIYVEKKTWFFFSHVRFMFERNHNGCGLPFHRICNWFLNNFFLPDCWFQLQGKMDGKKPQHTSIWTDFTTHLYSYFPGI